MSWIQDAALYVNPKLLSSSRGRSVALHAVTRLDLSGNALNSIPLAVLQMTSLRYVYFYFSFVRLINFNMYFTIENFSGI